MRRPPQAVITVRGKLVSKRRAGAGLVLGRLSDELAQPVVGEVRLPLQRPAFVLDQRFPAARQIEIRPRGDALGIGDAGLTVQPVQGEQGRQIGGTECRLLLDPIMAVVAEGEGSESNAVEDHPLRQATVGSVVLVGVAVGRIGDPIDAPKIVITSSRK